MASINGLSVKSIKKFFGHEGEPLLQGNLYLGNKKIGAWSQDSWGGPDHFLLDANYSEHLLNQAVIALNPDKTRTFGEGKDTFVMKYNLERLITDCIDLAEDEKAFRGALSSGYFGIVVATDGHHQTTWKLPKRYTEMSDEVLLKELAPQIERAKQSFWKEDNYTKHKIKVYRSLDEFAVGEPIQAEQIARKKDLGDIIAGATKASEQKAQDAPGKDKGQDPER